MLIISWWGLTTTSSPPSHRITPHLDCSPSAPHTLYLLFTPDDPLKSESSAQSPAFRMKAAVLQSLLLLVLLGLVALGASYFPRGCMKTRSAQFCANISVRLIRFAYRCRGRDADRRSLGHARVRGRCAAAQGASLHATQAPTAPQVPQAPQTSPRLAAPLAAPACASPAPQPTVAALPALPAAAPAPLRTTVQRPLCSAGGATRPEHNAAGERGGRGGWGGEELT